MPDSYFKRWVHANDELAIEKEKLELRKASELAIERAKRELDFQGAAIVWLGSARQLGDTIKGLYNLGRIKANGPRDALVKMLPHFVVDGKTVTVKNVEQNLRNREKAQKAAPKNFAKSVKEKH
jgi:hypothetical protein